jgi:nucleoside-diphosphate-sugar epimerase
LGNPAEMTILDFAKTVRDKFEEPLEIEYFPLPSDDPKLRRPDITKAKKLLSWEPKVGLSEGLEKTIAYFKESVWLTPQPVYSEPKTITT